MKIKRYTALSMRAALALVRAEQGPDAVILSSRRGEDGIEVIAAVDYDEALFVDMNRQRTPASAIAPAPETPAAERSFRSSRGSARRAAGRPTAPVRVGPRVAAARSSASARQRLRSCARRASARNCMRPHPHAPAARTAPLARADAATPPRASTRVHHPLPPGRMRATAPCSANYRICAKCWKPGWPA